MELLKKCDSCSQGEGKDHVCRVYVVMRVVTSASLQCSNCRGFGGLNPLTHLTDPLHVPLVKIRPRGPVSTYNVSFVEV